MAAATANCENRSIRRAVFSSSTPSGSNPFTSPPNRTLNSDTSNRSIGPIPLRPLVNPSQKPRTSQASGLIVPNPVITTLRAIANAASRSRTQSPESPSIIHRHYCITFVILCQELLGPGNFILDEITVRTLTNDR